VSATVYAVANQKGGVAKTTTVVSLAAALTELGQAVLAIDLDPQSALTFSLGYDADLMDPTMYDVLVRSEPLERAIVQHAETDVAVANSDLAAAEVTLAPRPGRELRLRAALAPLRDTYDIVLIDCPPSLGVLTLNGLTAADRLVVPVQCETLAHRGVAQLLETVADVRDRTNDHLQVQGFVATMFDSRTRHGAAVIADVATRYHMPLLGVPVRSSVRFAEAPHAGTSILSYAGDVPGAAAYRVIAAELVGAEVNSQVRAAAAAPRRRSRTAPPGQGR
jgi:chromosome partitioning protein